MSGTGAGLRIAAFAAVVLCAGLAQARGELTVSAEAAAVVLLPPSIDGVALSRRWDNPLHDTLVEQGAEYRAAGGRSIQLDFFRNTRAPHDAAFCLQARGERVRAQAFSTVAVRGGSMPFDVLVTETDGLMRLTAASECRAGGCGQEVLQAGGSLGAWFDHAVRSASQEPRVPLAIVLEQPLGDTSPQGMAATEAQLRQDFARVAAEFDPQPARQLAQLLRQGS